MAQPTYFTVEADYQAVSIDTATDIDADPTVSPISATVTFTPLIAEGDAILATDAEPRPTGFVAAPIVATIGTDGRLKLRSAPDGTAVTVADFASLPGTGSDDAYYVTSDDGKHWRWNGAGYDEIPPYQPVRLLADTPLLELAGPLYYSVAFSNVIYNGRAGRLTGFNFQAPTSDTTINLIEVGRAAGEPGTGIAKATVTVGSTTTLEPGVPATVTNTGSPTAGVFNFGIPQGEKGDKGDQGIPGATNTADDITVAAEKATPADADVVPVVDSAASWSLKKLSWANIKAAIGAWYDTATRTLTNKTLTSPTVGVINGTNGGPYLKGYSGTAAGSNHFVLSGTNTGNPVYFSARGDDANISMYVQAKGSGGILLRNDNGISATFGALPNSVNRIDIYGRETGQAPGITATGTDTNVSLNLTTKGSGTVQANGVPIVTTSGTQALSNKTIDGASNTVTNLPASATPDAARIVCTTATGGATAEDGANTWAKVATINLTAPARSATLILGVTLARNNVGAGDNVLLSVYCESNISTPGYANRSNVEIIGGSLGVLAADGFKIISGGYGTPYELWVKKTTTYSFVVVSELNRAIAPDNATVTYHNGAPWQSATPTGAVTNVVSQGMTFSGVPVVTTTGTQAISNKTIKIDQNNSLFTSPNTGSNGGARTVYGLAEYRSSVNNQTGAIVFYAPDSSTTIMHQFEVAGLRYNTGHVDMVVQGYRSGDVWSDLRKTSNGQYDVQTRWGVAADGRSCLILGDVDTTWGYPHFSIVRAMFSHLGVTDAYCSGWTVDAVTDLSGFIHVSSDVPLVPGVIHSSIVTTTGTQSLSNKTLTSPTLTNPIAATFMESVSGRTALRINPSHTDPLDYIEIRPTTTTPQIRAAGTSTNVNLALYTKGSGTFRLAVDNQSNTPTLLPDNGTADCSLDLRSNGSGTVRANGQSVIADGSPVVYGGANEIPAGDFEDAKLIRTSPPGKVLSTAQKLSGTQSLKMTGYTYHYLPQDVVSGAAKTVPCNPGDVVSAEAWVYGDDANQDTAEVLYLRIDFLRADGTWEDYKSRPMAAGDALKGVWTKLTTSKMAPANAVGYVITLYQLGSTTAVPGNVYYWDGMRAAKDAPSTSGRLVATTTAGGIGAEDGAGTWVKIAEFDIGTTYQTASAILNVSQTLASNEQAVIAVCRRNLGTGAPTMTIDWVSKPSAAGFFTTNSFKFVCDGWDRTAELWLRKNASGGKFNVYEMASSFSHHYCTARYFSNLPWQSAVPTGVTEVTSPADATWFGVPVVTTTGSQALTNKTLTSPTMSSPRISDNLIKDSNGNTVLGFSPSASAVNYVNIWNRATSGAAPVVEAWGSDTDVNLNLRGKGAGIVQINGNAAGVKVAVPATATSTGVPGQWAADASYHYVCTATNTWRRAALSSW